MNSELVKTIVSLLLNFPENEPPNIIDWKFVAGTLTVKLEENDGSVTIYSFSGQWEGYAKTPERNNFEAVLP